MANFCQNCGTKIVPGSRFCENCGAPLEMETTASTASTGVNNVAFAKKGDDFQEQLKDSYEKTVENAEDQTEDDEYYEQPVQASRKALHDEKKTRKSPSKLLLLMIAAVAVFLVLYFVEEYQAEKRLEERLQEQREQFAAMQNHAASGEADDETSGDVNGTEWDHEADAAPGGQSAQNTDAASFESFLLGDAGAAADENDDILPEDSSILEETVGADDIFPEYESLQEDTSNPESSNSGTENPAASNGDASNTDGGSRTDRPTDEHGYYLPTDTAASVSTQSTPSLDEFDWFLNDVLMSGVPSNAENINDPSDIVGSWKCLVVYDPQNKEGKEGYHLATMEIMCRESDGKHFMGPYILWNTVIDAEGNVSDESARNPFLSVGNFADGWYGEGGNGNMSLKFWTTGDGKQYAWGSANMQDVGDNIVVLVRP